MNTIETTSENLNLDEILFKQIFQVSGEDGEELELKSSVDKGKYPNLSHTVESYIENMNSLKETHGEIQKSTDLKNYEKEKIESIHKSLFQDGFFLTYLQYIFNQYGENIASLEELDKELGKLGHTELLTYGTLLHCYENNEINWNQVKDINKDISIKIALEKKFHLEYGMEKETDYPAHFNEDINGLKSFFNENNDSQIDLSEKVMFVDQDNSSDYIKQQVKYDLMYTLGGEVQLQLNNLLNESGLTDILININRKWHNLNTNQVIQTLQDECKGLLQLVSDTDSITEKDDYNKELANLEDFLKDINFSYGQTELIKTKLLSFVEEYIGTLLILQEKEFHIEEDMKDIFEKLIKKGKELDIILKEEEIFELSGKLKMIPFLKKNIEKDILMKNLYDNILSEKHILAYNQILQYINTFGEDNSIKLIKQHINIEGIIDTKIEISFQKLNAFENPKDVLAELKSLKTQLNNLGKDEQVSQKLSDILVFLEAKIEIGKKELGLGKGLSHIKNSYIKAKLRKWQRNMEKHIRLAIDGDSESISKLVNIREFPFKTEKFIIFLDTLENIQNHNGNTVKTIIELDKYLKKSAGTTFLKNLVKETIENKQESLILEIKETVKGLETEDTKEIGETIKGILGLEVWKEIGNTTVIYDINPDYLEYIGQELQKGENNTKLLKLYKELFFREITIADILEDEEKLTDIFNYKNFGANLHKVYQTLKKVNKENFILLIVEEYIITQDQEKIEKHLKDLFIK